MASPRCRDVLSSECLLIELAIGVSGCKKQCWCLLRLNWVRSARALCFGKRLVRTLVKLTLMSKKKKEEPVELVVEAPAIVRSGNPIFDFVVKDMFGEDVPMLMYEGKVLLIVNVASMGTLTTQNYTELTELYTKYKGQDFEILAFPCNQFGAKEPGDLEQIKEFATTRFSAEYPIFDKINVNGPQESPLWKYLKSQKGGGLLGDSIKWNFAKFLVDKSGNVVGRYGPTTPPSKIEKDIQTYVSNSKSAESAKSADVGDQLAPK